MTAMSERMKTALERDIKAITLRPSTARGRDTITAVTTSDGVTTATEDDNSIVVDLAKSHGGAGTTPGQGFLLCATLASCLSQGYLIWAAHFGVPIDRIIMEIQAEYDVIGAFGIDESVPCGYTALRILVEVDSPAPRADVERVVETTERRSFMRAILTDEHKVERELRVRSSAAA